MPILHAPGVMMPACALQRAFDPYHVLHGNAFGDCNDEFDVRIGSFKNCIGGKRRRHKNAGYIGPGLVHGLRDSVENGDLLAVQLDGLAAAARRDSANELRPVFQTLLGVEFASRARDALHNQACVVVYQDAHDRLR